MRHGAAVTAQIAGIVVGSLIIVWMFTSHPASAHLPDAQPAAASPAIQGDISSAAWSAKCFPVPEESPIDPIKDWGPGSIAPHVHEFFAQQTINSTTSPGALLTPTAAPLNCDGPTKIPDVPGCTYNDNGTNSVCDRSAYWVPELVWDPSPLNMTVSPSVLVPDHTNIYWRNEYTDPQLDTYFPQDLAMVAGNGMATTPQNPWIVNWQCVVPQEAQKTQTPGRYSPVIPSTCRFPIDDICPGGSCYPVYLRMVITFPECIEPTPNATQGIGNTARHLVRSHREPNSRGSDRWRPRQLH